MHGFLTICIGKIFRSDFSCKFCILNAANRGKMQQSSVNVTHDIESLNMQNREMIVNNCIFFVLFISHCCCVTSL